MQFVQAQLVALPQNYEFNLSKVLTTLRTFFAVVEEGFNKADQYEALARKSNRELTALDLSREDLPGFVMFGKK